MIDRTALTDLLTTRLADTDVPIGDHEAPANVGWRKGTTNVEAFVPYLVLSTGSATATPSGLCLGRYDWRATYQVRGYAATRTGADQLCSRAAEALQSGERVEVGQHRVNVVSVDALSGITADRSVRPALFSVTITATVQLSALP